MTFVGLYALLLSMLCFHVHTCMLSSVMKHAHRQNIRKKIPFQTFEKWHNVSYRYASYAKSEISDTWRTGAWFLKPFGEKVEEYHIYDLIKQILQ